MVESDARSPERTVTWKERLSLMQNTLALNIPQSGPALSRNRVAWIDIITGMRAVDIWGRPGLARNQAALSPHVFGPFWTTVGLALFVTTLGLVWANLWHRDPKDYLPYLTPGWCAGCCSRRFARMAASAFWSLRKLLTAIADFLHVARLRQRLAQCDAVFSQSDHLCAGLHLCRHLPCHVDDVAGRSGVCAVLPQRGLDHYACWARSARVFATSSNWSAHLLQISLFLTPIFWSTDQLTGTHRDTGGIQSDLSSHRDRARAAVGQGAGASHWVVVIAMTISAGQ